MLDGYGDDTLEQDELIRELDANARYALRSRSIWTTDPRYDDLHQEAVIAQWRAVQANASTNRSYRRQAAGWRVDTMLHETKAPLGSEAYGGVARPRLTFLDPLDGQEAGDSLLHELVGAAPLLDLVQAAYHRGILAEAFSALTPKEREYVYRRFWLDERTTDLHKDFAHTTWSNAKRKLARALAPHASSGSSRAVSEPAGSLAGGLGAVSHQQRSWGGVVPVELAIAELVAKEQAALLSDSPEAARYAVLDAAVILAQAFPLPMSDGHGMVQLLATKLAYVKDWRLPDHEEHTSFSVVSTRSLHTSPERLHSKAAWVIDTRGLTRDSTTTLWQALAPRVRAHRRPVLLYIERSDWPRHLVHLEWLGHMDRHLVFLNELDVRRATKAS